MDSINSMGKSIRAYIGLGSNLGDRKRFIEDALRMLGQTPDIEVVTATGLVQTQPLANAEQAGYLNAVAELRTVLSAERLHQRLLEIENTLGRFRDEKWASRTIDIDLLLYGDEIIDSDTLIIPHPQMHLRSFVLKGLCEFNPQLAHPVLGETVEVLAKRLNGGDFAPSEGPKLISIAGNIGAGKTTLTKKLAEIFSCRAVFEAYDTNPFLPKVYAGNTDLALDSQLYFLASRIEQLNPGVLEKGENVITDYIFQKEQIYANTLLSSEQLELYNKIYACLSPGVKQPDLVVYLRTSPRQCLQRIESRNRPYERKIEHGFLQKIEAGYEELIAGWKQCPVITLTDFDCLNEKGVERLAGQVKYYVNPKSTCPSGQVSESKKAV